MEHQEEQIEQYLESQLKGEELQAFEERLLTDATFASEVKTARIFREKLITFGKRNELKGKLSAIHNEMLKEHTKPVSGSKVRWQTWYPTMAIAASVALITSLGTFWLFQSLHNSPANGKAQYRELRKDVEQIKKSQNRLLREFYAEKLTPDPRHFSGTGFAISSNGFIVTSFHVVRNATIVWLENDRYHFKARCVHTNARLDLAVLKIEDSTFSSFGKLPYTMNTAPKAMGDRMYTIGYPREDMVYAEGYIASLTGYEGDSVSYQVSVPVNPGNSGGPLLDQNGAVAGIVSGKLTEAEGVAFALRMQYIAASLKEWNKIHPDQKIVLPKAGSLAGLTRTRQIQKLNEFVFKVAVTED